MVGRGVAGRYVCGARHVTDTQNRAGGTGNEHPGCFVCAVALHVGLVCGNPTEG